MICSKCNTLNDNDNKKCVRCGAKLEKSGNNTKISNHNLAYLNNHRGSDITKETNKSNNKVRLVLISLIFILLSYYLYDMEKIQAYWKGNKQLQEYYLKTMLFINPAYQLQTESMIVEEKEAIEQKKKKKDSVKIVKTVEPEYDYYEVLKKKKVKTFVKEDTIIYKSESDAEAAGKLKKENKQIEKIYYAKDNKMMMLIPAQKFVMGSDTGSELETPAHNVSVNSFYMDAYEVTNAEFLRFLKDSGYKKAEEYKHFSDPKLNKNRQPMVDVSYEDASAYATWSGKRLPTEEEWECAAKSGKNWLYPTGDSIDRSIAAIEGNALMGQSEIVGSYKPNSYGIYDLAGNVEEWVSSVLNRYPGNDLINTSYGKFRITRGGNWRSDKTDLVTYRRSTLRISGSTGLIGFRCVTSVSAVKRGL